MGADRLATAHLLLGLRRAEESFGADALLAQCVSLESARDAVRRAIAARPDEDASLAAPGAAAPTPGPADSRPADSEAGEVVRRARALARERGHGFVGTEHLLLGIVAVGGSAADALSAAGATDAVLREAVAALRAPGAVQPPPLPQVSPSARRALEATAAVAHDLGETAPRSGHLLLALLDVPESLGVTALRSLRVDLDALRARVRAGLLPRN